MTLQGYQFDNAKVTPEADAQLYSYLAQASDNKVISGLTATTTGLNIYVSTGKALVQGRLIENGQQMHLTAQANKTGYVCITIDLTQDNASTGTPGASDYVPVNNQLRLELVDTLNQQNLNSGGLIYTFPLYSYVSTGATVNLTKVAKSFPVLEKTANITLAYDTSAVLIRRGNIVYVSFPVQNKAILTKFANSITSETIPLGFRPSSDRHNFHVNRSSGSDVLAPAFWGFDKNGDVYLTNSVTELATLSGSTMYFTNDDMPD